MSQPQIDTGNIPLLGPDGRLAGDVLPQAFLDATATAVQAATTAQGAAALAQQAAAHLPADGAQGIPGTNGAPGAPGADGAPGAKGDTGPPGASQQLIPNAQHPGIFTIGTP